MTLLVLLFVIVSALSSSSEILCRIPNIKCSRMLPKFGSSHGITKSTPTKASTTAHFSTENNAVPDNFKPLNLYTFSNPSFYSLSPQSPLGLSPNTPDYPTFFELQPESEHNPNLRHLRTLPLFCKPTVHCRRVPHIAANKASYFLLKRVPDGISHNLGTSEGLIDPTFVLNPLPPAQPIFSFRPIDSINAPVVV